MFNRFNRCISIFAVVLPVVLFSAFNGPAVAQEDRVAVVVNGTEILLSEVRESVSSLPQQYQQMPYDALYPHLVERLVSMHLLAGDAVSQGLDKTEDFTRNLTALTMQLRERTALTDEIKKQVTEETIKVFYLDYVAALTEKEEVHARHILLKNKEDADKVIAELASGGDFESLAKEHSTGPSGPQGGDLGFFSNGQMVPAFEAAAFALEIGQYTEAPVETRFGWHIIKLEERRAMPVPSMADIGDKIREELIKKVEDAYMDRLMGQATVSRFDMNGDPMDAPTVTAQ
jgi:peptidyl-prolyl cis-trans isomerase C